MAELKKVIGLKYDPGEGVPQVVVKGAGAAAEELLRQRDALGGPPLVHDSALAGELYRLPMDAPIGPELLTNLDEAKRLDFLKRWQAAMKGQ